MCKMDLGRELWNGLYLSGLGGADIDDVVGVLAVVDGAAVGVRGQGGALLKLR